MQVVRDWVINADANGRKVGSTVRLMVSHPA
jgi:hypothetical protein